MAEQSIIDDNGVAPFDQGVELEEFEVRPIVGYRADGSGVPQVMVRLQGSSQGRDIDDVFVVQAGDVQLVTNRMREAALVSFEEVLRRAADAEN